MALYAQLNLRSVQDLNLHLRGMSPKFSGLLPAVSLQQRVQIRCQGAVVFPELLADVVSKIALTARSAGVHNKTSQEYFRFRLVVP